MAEELIDIYDEKMNLLGTATREQAHREGLWHTSFHCWIVRRSPEGRPQVLLQIRGKTQNHPSLIDISSAGHLAAGETAHDGIKNIELELGLKVDFGKLVKLFTANHVFQKNNYINHEFNPTYLLEDSTPLPEYKLNPDWVDGVFIADVEDVLNLCQRPAPERTTQLCPSCRQHRPLRICSPYGPILCQSDGNHPALV